MDHHAHLWSTRAAAEIVALKQQYGYPLEPGDSLPRTAEMLVAAMDSAQIRRSVVLAAAYLYGAHGSRVDDEEALVRRENEWLAEAVRRFPDRLLGFCSVNPLADYALAEIDRCSGAAELSGLKLHFPNSGVDLGQPEHVARLEAVFRAADARGMPVIVHLWTPAWESDHSVARRDAEVFVHRLLPAAPAVPVQIAHLAGGGVFSPGADVASGVLAAAVEAGLPGTATLWFDVAAILHPQLPPEATQRIVERMRQIGIGRILYGSDGAPGAADWNAFMTTLPLTESELATIRSNLAPYL